MSDRQFDRVFLQAEYEIDRFVTALARLESYDYPSDAAPAIVAMLREAMANAGDSLSRIKADVEDDPDGAKLRLDSAYRSLQQHRSFLDSLEKARSTEVPWSCVPSLEKLSSNVLPGRRLLISVTTDMTYCVGWYRKADLPVVVWLPRLHRANAFFHVLVGHELFHPAVAGYVATAEKGVRRRLLAACRQYSASSPEPDLFGDGRLDQLGSVLELHFPGPGRSSQDGSFDGRGLARRARRWSTSV